MEVGFRLPKLISGERHGHLTKLAKGLIWLPRTESSILEIPHFWKWVVSVWYLRSFSNGSLVVTHFSQVAQLGSIKIWVLEEMVWRGLTWIPRTSGARFSRDHILVNEWFLGRTRAPFE